MKLSSTPPQPMRHSLAIIVAAALLVSACGNANTDDPPGGGGSAGAAGSAGETGGTDEPGGAGGGESPTSSGAGGGDDTGGESPTSGGAGGAGGEPPSPVLVYSWGEEGNEPSITTKPWVVDTTLGAGSGANALHPPAFDAGDSFDFKFDCGGKAHSQLRFLLGHFGGGVALSLQVGGEKEPRVVAQYTGGFAEQIIDVEPGVHSYTFTASAEADAPPSVIIDSFECLAATPFPAENANVDFDDGFIPIEVSGDWQVDNLLGVAGGETAIHPPAFDAGDEYSFELTCDAKDHSQLRFLLGHFGGGVALSLQVSGEKELRVVPQYTGGFAEQIIDVEPGAHTYTFTASAEADAPPSVIIDSFACLGTTPFPAENANVDFDDGFIPIEVSGDWQVDNLLGVAGGETAIHPPAFDAGDEYLFELSCDAKDHSQLRFLLGHFGGGVALSLRVSGEHEPRVVPQYTGGFAEEIIDVEPGAHTYTFTASAEADAPPSVIIDSFVCK